MHLKLNELIRALEGAYNALLDLEELTQEDLDRLREQYEELARRARELLRQGAPDTDRPDLAVRGQSMLHEGLRITYNVGRGR